MKLVRLLELLLFVLRFALEYKSVPDTLFLQVGDVARSPAKNAPPTVPELEVRDNNQLGGVVDVSLGTENRRTTLFICDAPLSF